MREYETFGKWLKATRLEADFTLRKLADESGVSASYLSLLENDLADRPSQKVLKGIAQAFDIPVNEVVKMANVHLTVIQCALNRKSLKELLASAMCLSDEDVERLIQDSKVYERKT